MNGPYHYISTINLYQTCYCSLPLAKDFKRAYNIIYYVAAHIVHQSLSNRHIKVAYLFKKNLMTLDYQSMTQYQAMLHPCKLHLCTLYDFLT